MPSHYLNQCWNFVDWTVMNMFQWHLNRNAYIFIQENAFQNVVCKMAAVCLGLNVLIQSQRASSVGLKPKNYPATLWSSEYVFCWGFFALFYYAYSTDCCGFIWCIYQNSLGVLHWVWDNHSPSGQGSNLDGLPTQSYIKPKRVHDSWDVWHIFQGQAAILIRPEFCSI